MKWRLMVSAVITGAMLGVAVDVFRLNSDVHRLQGEILTSRTNEMIALEWVQRVQKNVEDIQFSTFTLFTNDLHRMERERER